MHWQDKIEPEKKVVEYTLPDGCKAKSGVVTKQTLMYTYSVAVMRRRITKRPDASGLAN